MAIFKTEILPLPFSLSEKDGNRDCLLYLFLPDSPPRAILQICHGMCEYFLRYRPFAEWLCERGVLVCGCDHPGHGQRALEDGSLGYIPGGKDLSLAVEMQQEIYLHLRKTYRHLPYLLLGHSMGSFIARKYITRYKDTVDGVILMGTCAGNRSLSLGIAMADVISFFCGKRRPSRFLMRLAFGHYNDRFPGEKGSAWLSRNRENVKAHDGDPLCRFYFSASAMRQVFGCLREINADKWYDDLPLSLPVLLLSGEDDPVGEYGEGIRQIYGKMEDRELCHLGMKLYPGDRHEILNEEDRENVYGDILDFLNDVTEGVTDARTEHYNALFYEKEGQNGEETV